MIVVRYADGKKVEEEWPDYDEKCGLPVDWETSGSESALDNQPEWQTTNAFWHGPSKSKNKAKKAVEKMYQLYEKEGYVVKFVVEIE